jgi:hypothetical protein
MPHLVLRGTIDLARLAADSEPGVARWRLAVLKTGDAWFRSDGNAVLIEGVVVEHTRPLHPVAAVALRDGDTIIRLWPVVPVERTPAVQRWLAVLARRLQDRGGGAVRTTNIGLEILDGLGLEMDLG